MLNLPKSTKVGKRIPKQKFYEHLDITPAMRRAFVEQIKVIYWRNKIAATTMNLAIGKDVTELEVFTIKLNSEELDEFILRQIDKEIPYHILFLLQYDDKYQAWIGYKEAAASGNMSFKVNRYYHTPWMMEEDLSLKIEGLSTDAVYENLVRQIAGEALKTRKPGESLEETINREEKVQALKRQIEKLQTKIRKERQLNLQMKMNGELKKLKARLEKLQ